MELAALGAEVVGIDLHEESIEIAKQNCPLANAKFEVADAETLKVSRQFDVIICSHVIEHLREPKDFVRKIHSLLKNDGIALIALPNGYGPSEIIEPLEKNMLENKTIATALRVLAIMFFGYRRGKNHVPAILKRHSPHLHFFTYHSIRRLLIRNGLVIESMWGTVALSSLLRFSPFLRKFTLLERMDAITARALPLIASSWLILCRRG
jgi:SAM-dependent methyltransferase